MPRDHHGRAVWARAMVAALGALALAFGCSATGSSPTGGGPGGGGGAAASGSGGNGGVLLGGSGGGGPCPSCSTDLKRVIDCNGNVSKECGTGQACAAGQCIDDPCEAARIAQTTAGCDYLTVKPPTFPLSSCYAIFVANTWPEHVHLRVERGATQFNPAGFVRIPQGQGSSITYQPFNPGTGLPPGEVAILFMSFGLGALSVPCPAGVVPALPADGSAVGTTIADAFHIVTDAPVVAYQIFPYGGGNVAQTTATLLLPTSAWGDNHVIVGPGQGSSFQAFDIVAAEDATEVTIRPKAAIAAGTGVAAAPAGQPTTYSLQRGQYLQVSQLDDFTGSPVKSNKPVGVFGSTNCLNVPASACCCDSAHQQIPSVRALGHEYAAIRYRNRASLSSPGDETVPWRMVGVVDGTTFTYDPAPPPGAPSSLGLGQIAEFWAPGPFLVRAQDDDHPFYMAGYMTGCEYVAASGIEGDAEWVNLVPTSQFRESYVFFSDVTYPDTNLVLVRARGANGQFADVSLDCAGVIGDWQTLGAFEFARFDLVRGGAGNGACGNGRHVIQSAAPFGLTVWGWGSDFATQAVSYAYPAGQGLKPVNEVVVPVTPR
ncbi:MAG: IgGFc-binding protein [Polyangiaceae bacterium]|nr:IgGFc-binding protein [Polyangiaceae bacterium]